MENKQQITELKQLIDKFDNELIKGLEKGDNIIIKKTRDNNIKLLIQQTKLLK